MRITPLFLLGIFFVGAVHAVDDIQVQMLKNRLETLQAERNQKAAELQKCEKNVRGFKTAGIATLYATGVGIGVNISLASELAKGNAGGGAGGGRTDAAADIRSPEQVTQDNADLFAELGI